MTIPNKPPKPLAPWVRLPGATPNDDAEIDSEFDFHLAEAVYGRGGKKWPRLVIAVNAGILYGPFQRSFSVSVATKDKPKDWWESTPGYVGVPFELFDDLIALLEEAKAVFAVLEETPGMTRDEQILTRQARTRKARETVKKAPKI